jgi:hypothetical protein
MDRLSFVADDVPAARTKTARARRAMDPVYVTTHAVVAASVLALPLLSAWNGWAVPLFVGSAVSALFLFISGAMLLASGTVMLTSGTVPPRRTWRTALLLWGVVHPAVFLGSVVFGALPVHRASVAASRARGDDVVDAIHTFHRRHGRFPSSLGEIERETARSLPTPTQSPAFDYVGTESAFTVTFRSAFSIFSIWEYVGPRGEWRERDLS